MSHYFESKNITQLYVKYRPNYNYEVVETVIGYLKKKNNTNQEKFDLMIDVGCGSGQATKRFAKYFHKTIGFDVSLNQIAEANLANQTEHVTYRVGKAESLDVADQSVDLVICATAAHWFNLPAFFKEVKRVLKNNGCLAIFCQRIDEITPVNPEDPTVGVANYENTNMLEDYIRKAAKDIVETELVFDGYRKIFAMIPSADKERCDSIQNHRDWNLQEALGYMSSFGSFQKYMKTKMRELIDKNVIITDELLTSVDLVQQFRSKIRKTWNIADEKQDCEVKMNGDATQHILMACHLE